jgi:serine/threonine protein kinase
LAAGYVFRQLCDALRYIHARKIIHRDLKPENILVHSSSVFAEGKLVVKISDFGHSKIIDDGYSIAQTRCGTPQYWAPEVAAGGGRYDQKVDLWSLGVVLYVMLEGQYPFAGERAEERMREANFTPPHHASNGSKEIIRGLIQRQPEQRWTEDTCLQHRWLRAVGVPWQSEQVDDESIKLQVTPTEAETKSLRRELERFNAKYKLFPAVLRNMNQVVVTWSESSERKSGSKEEARRELLSMLAPYCPTGEGVTSGNSASGVAVGAPLATVTEEHGRRGRLSTGSGRQV